MEKAPYLVTDSIADSDKDDIRECYIIHDGSEGQVLVYHPVSIEEAEQGNCPSIEICVWDDAFFDGKWKTVLKSQSKNSYVNLAEEDMKHNKPLARFLGKKNAKIIGHHSKKGN